MKCNKKNAMSWWMETSGEASTATEALRSSALLLLFVTVEVAVSTLLLFLILIPTLAFLLRLSDFKNSVESVSFTSALMNDKLINN